MELPKLTFVFGRKGTADNRKESVVELRISHGKDRLYISTGVKLLAKEWSNGSVVGRKDWKELNDQLQVIKSKCSEIIVELMEADMLDIKAIPSLLKNRIEQKKTFLEYAKECAEVRTKDLADGTKKRYEVVFDFLDRWKGIVYFTDVTEKNIRKMDDYLAKKGLKECSRYNYHKVVKCFVRMAFGDGLIKINPYVKFQPKRGEDEGLHRVLTPAEFIRFETCVINTPSLERVRDLFVFQTYTMMGYGDLEEFDYKKCVKVKGQWVYKSKRVKTKQEFVIPMQPKALSILQKYNHKLPIISNEKYNMYLKAAVKYAGIDKPVTTHWARHTGATILANNGVPMYIIQHILGHASIRETEKTYAKVLDSTIVDSMIEYQQRSNPSAEVKKCSIVNLRVTHGKVK